ncbi:MAG TPA: LPS assembly lipoprotein LptE [Candidatus Competibacter sp.]|nr:LPS assembly lipoprotein LptE [Candidatus Competibacter sp.]
MRWIIASGLGLIVLLLAGCGFQLRGQAQLPPELRVTYVQSQQGIGMPPGALDRKLRSILASNGVTVTRDPAQATAVITILNEGSGRRTVAADRFDVKREYFLIYNATYEVKLANGKVLVAAEGINANRALLFDENRILGFEAAQESLVDGMADDLAWQIIRRLQAVKS